MAKESTNGVLKTKIQDEQKTKPFLKWAGGKYKIIEELKRKFPKKANRFFEPFLGAGSVALNVDYPEYIVNDTNDALVSVWRHLKNEGVDFINACEELFVPKNNKREVFDKLKAEFNTTKDKFRKAILFIYLNRHCFNGLCRYNGSGEYNVPFGKYDVPYFPRKELEKCLPKIANFRIHGKDFREILDMVGKDDLAYCDPPYMPLSESANFDSYSVGGFTLKDQMDLAELAMKAAKRGAIVVVSNHYNWYAQQIYSKMYGAKTSSLDVSRTISSKTEERNSIKEILAVFKKDNYS